MRDMRPDNESPTFQQVPFEPDPPSRGGGAAFAALALFATPFVLALGLFAWWPDDEITGEAPAGGAAPYEVAAAEVETDPVRALAVAQERVQSLQAEIDARKAELEDLHNEREGERAAADTRVAELQQEMAALNGRLQKAQVQRDDLRGRLATALADLDREIGTNNEARRQVVALTSANTENVWVAFTQDAKIDICEQLTERGREKCRERIDGWFDDDRHDRFASCVVHHRTVPSLWRRSGKAALPETAELMDVGPGKRQDWYVQFCDPTLPEAVIIENARTEPPVFMAGLR